MSGTGSAWVGWDQLGHTDRLSPGYQFSESGDLNSLSLGLSVGLVVTGCARVCPRYQVSVSGAAKSLSLGNSLSLGL